jgi:hypothetical protein
MKQQLATNLEFMQSLRQHAIGKEAFGKYQHGPMIMARQLDESGTNPVFAWKQRGVAYNGVDRGRRRNNPHYSQVSDDNGTTWTGLL